MDSLHKHFRWTLKRIILLIFLVLLTQVGITFGIYKIMKKAPYVPNVNSTVKALSSNCTETNAANLIKPNVVRIENKTEKGIIYGSGFFEKNGYLVTNSHIVDTKGTITVYFTNGTSAAAEIYSNDHAKDLAILSVKTSGVNALDWGDTAKLTIPQTLLAFGYALNLQGEVTVTQGVFSARRFYNNISFLQTDTPINSGNSGGPLVNVCGQVIGINTVATDNATINMAISSESAQSIINDLITHKNVAYSDGSAPDTVLSKEFNTKGGELSQYSGSNYVSLADSNNNGNNNNNNSLNQNNENYNNGSQLPNNSAPQKKDSAPICGRITASNSSIQTTQSIDLNFSYSGTSGKITWSGEGTFGPDQDSSPYFSRVTWSNEIAGQYNLKATVETENGQCSESIKITVTAPPPPVCGEITATRKTVELVQLTVLDFSYTGTEGEITWSGGGNFGSDENPSAFASSVKWSSEVSGTYTLTAKAKNKAGECSKDIIITVLTPATRIEGLDHVNFYFATYYNPYNNKDQSIGVSWTYRDYINNFIWTSRTDYTPVTADVTIRYNDKILYQHNYTWDEIKLKNEDFRLNNISIRQGQMNIVSEDLVRGVLTPIAVDITLHTLEQGDFKGSSPILRFDGVVL